ncbi:hypothetical protein G7Y89_g2442 [Cudoniella acicularis]|uniref:Zn(2)-C6 fungal-type domain-containing protein n=1 Tax=Cudoniella acicularis TaxID=354080 RepID=A0A8H4RTA4_9HELO|nr:hypothetical protein G7Y89_g2442 [Cudoniella acicularis]
MSYGWNGCTKCAELRIECRKAPGAFACGNCLGTNNYCFQLQNPPTPVVASGSGAIDYSSILQMPTSGPTPQYPPPPDPNYPAYTYPPPSQPNYLATEGTTIKESDPEGDFEDDWDDGEASGQTLTPNPLAPLPSVDPSHLSGGESFPAAPAVDQDGVAETPGPVSGYYVSEDYLSSVIESNDCPSCPTLAYQFAELNGKVNCTEAELRDYKQRLIEAQSKLTDMQKTHVHKKFSKKIKSDLDQANELVAELKRQAQEKCEKLEEQIKELNERIKGLEPEPDAAAADSQSTQVQADSTLSEENNSLNDRLKSLQSLLNQERNDHQNEINQRDLTISHLQGRRPCTVEAHTSLEVSNTDLQSRLNQEQNHHQTEIKQRDLMIAHLQGRRSCIVEAHASLEVLNSELRGQIQQESNQNEIDRSKLSDEIMSLKSTIASLEKERDEKKHEVSLLKIEKQNLFSDLEEQKNNITGLNAIMRLREKEISPLKTDNSDLECKVKQLEEEIKNLHEAARLRTEDVSSLETKESELEQKIKEQEKVISSLNEDSETQKKAIRSLEADKSQLEQKTKEQEETISSLNEGAETQKKAIRSLEAGKSNLEDQLEGQKRNNKKLRGIPDSRSHREQVDIESLQLQIRQLRQDAEAREIYERKKYALEQNDSSRKTLRSVLEKLEYEDKVASLEKKLKTLQLEYENLNENHHSILSNLQNAKEEVVKLISILQPSLKVIRHLTAQAAAAEPTSGQNARKCRSMAQRKSHKLRAGQALKTATTPTRTTSASDKESAKLEDTSSETTGASQSSKSPLSWQVIISLLLLGYGLYSLNFLREISPITADISPITTDLSIITAPPSDLVLLNGFCDSPDLEEAYLMLLEPEFKYDYDESKSIVRRFFHSIWMGTALNDLTWWLAMLYHKGPYAACHGGRRWLKDDTWYQIWGYGSEPDWTPLGRPLFHVIY